jgi:hypothetical protein
MSDLMRFPRERVRKTRLIQKGHYVVAVDVEMVIPQDVSSEPCYEPQTVVLLRQVAEHAEEGDVDWLRRHGKVYELVETA